MQHPLSDPCLNALHRAIADGSLTGPALHAMLIGPSPVSASGRRQTRDLSAVPGDVPGGRPLVLDVIPS
jgi:hypothetical protein